MERERKREGGSEKWKGGERGREEREEKGRES